MTVIKIEDVIFRKVGREAAKRRYVLRTRSLFEELLEENPGIETMRSKDFCSKLDEFIERKNIRITGEKATLRETDNRYLVDVEYDIEIG